VVDPQLSRQISVGWFNQYRTIFKNDGRDNLLDVVQFLDFVTAFFIVVDIDPVKSDALFPKKLL
jgi:hypothetical protein